MLKTTSTPKFIKTKAYGLVGAIMLFTSLIALSTASADETTPTTPTEPTTTQTSISKNDDLTNAISYAHENNIAVAPSSTTIVTSQEEATQQMTTDAQTITNKVNDYLAEKDIYDQKKTEYDQNMAIAEANTQTEGHLKELKSQALVYNRGTEPNATSTITQGTVVSEETVQAAAQNAANNGQVGDAYYLVNTVLDPNSTFIDAGTYVQLKANETTTIRYDNLENSSYNGQKISSVEYDYTPNIDCYAILYKDPTITIGLMNFQQAIDVKTTLRFYDDAKNLIALGDNALFGFNSLNRGKGEQYTDRTEYVNVDGKYVEINGSTIVVHSDGKAYADTINDWETMGMTHDWDNYDQPDFYKGGIVGIGKDGQLTFHFGNDGRVWQWFAVNSTIPVENLPILPTAPQKPELRYHNYVIVSTSSEASSEGHSEASSEGHSEVSSEGHSEASSEGHSEASSEEHSEASSEGHSEASSEGHSEANSEGHSEVSSEGHSEVSSEGHSEVSSEGHSEASSEGHSEASSEGHSEASSEGHSEASSEGHSEARSEGHSEASSEGHSEASSEGHSETSSEGHSEASSEGHSEASSEATINTKQKTLPETGDSETHTTIIGLIGILINLINLTLIVRYRNRK